MVRVKGIFPLFREASSGSWGAGGRYGVQAMLAIGGWWCVQGLASACKCWGGPTGVQSWLARVRGLLFRG